MKKIPFIVLILFLVLSLSACSFFTEDAEGVKDITFEETEEGDVKILVYYYDEGETVKEEIIPSGLDGKDGIGIDTVQVFRDKEANRNKIVITLTDNTSKEFYVPDGVKITEVTSEYDEGTGEYYMYVHYSDPENPVSDGILLPRGRDGIGIDTSKFETKNNDDGSVTVSWEFTDGTKKEVTIPTGKGIESITPGEENGKMILNILFTDGDSISVAFTRTSLWYQGYGKPTDVDVALTLADAIPGDFYLDLYGKKIYRLSDTSTWIELVDFARANDQFTVTFVPNGSTEEPVNPFQTSITDIEYGSYLIGRIPIPTRPGYTFVGWATSAVVTPTTGFFTELTPVTSNLTLYAIWE